MQLAAPEDRRPRRGRPRFRLPDWPDGSYQLQVTASPAGSRGPETVTQTIALKHSWRLIDQHRQAGLPAGPGHPYARPGAAAHRPQAGREPGDGLLPDRPARQRHLPRSRLDQPVRDRFGHRPARNVIFRDRGSTSRFGIGSASYPLAGELIEGNYQVECTVGETTSRTTVAINRRVSARVQVCPHAGSAVLPAGPAHQGTRPGRLCPRQAGRGRCGDRRTGVDRRRTEGPSNARAPHRREGRGGIRDSLARDYGRPRIRLGQRAGRDHGAGSRALPARPRNAPSPVSLQCIRSGSK